MIKTSAVLRRWAPSRAGVRRGTGRARGSPARADGQNGLARQRALCQLYGAVYCLLQPYLVRRGTGDHAADGALIFLAVGRHPVAGLLSAIAGVGCGFTANLLIVTTDVLLSGISTEAASTIDATMHVSVIDNWYFMASSVIVLTIVGV